MNQFLPVPIGFAMGTQVLFFLGFFTASLSMQPPQTWKENWFEHTQLLNRQYHDNDVAVYFDPDVDKSANWIFPFFHDVWVYVKKVYGKFGDDPILYGVFHSGKYSGSHATSYFERQKLYKNVVDCGIPSKDGWKLGTNGEHDLIVVTISLIIQGASHGVKGFVSFKISRHHFGDIILYDVYLGLNRTEDALQVRYAYMDSHQKVLGKKVYWFRDWFLPIYEKFGGSEVLNRFLELVAQHFPKSNTATFNRPEYARDMNYGEFFHFWSAASGRNLTKMARKVFGWNDRFQKEYQTAKKQFRQLNYYYKLPKVFKENWLGNGELLTRHFFDNEVAIYFDKNVDTSATWINKLLHDVWAYTKKNYGSFGPNPILFGIFHAGKSSKDFAYTYLENNLKSSKNFIDCGTVDGDAWGSESPEYVYFITKIISKIVQTAAHGVSNNPAFKLWGETFDDIFVLDVFLNINRTDAANRLYDTQLSEYTNTPKPKTYWFKDWFVPIYEQYGGSKVLNRYFELLATHFPKDVDKNKKRTYSRNMNFGELVHFWSGAALINLKGLANEAFGWSQKFEEQYQTARKEFPDVMYNNIVIL